MRVATVVVSGGLRAAIVEDDCVLVTNLGRLDEAIGLGPRLSEYCVSELPVDDADFDAPVRPPVIFCCGQNYRDHLTEQDERHRRLGQDFFLKAGQTIATPNEPCFTNPSITHKLDYETELGLVIGRTAYRVPPAHALEHVFGYVVLNDLSARDQQFVDNRVAIGPGKNFVGATRLAPFVTTAEEIQDPQRLTVTTYVNDQLRQASSTANMRQTCAELVAYISKFLPLPPGSIVATGTPGGTALGQDMELGGTRNVPNGCSPASYLEAGDRVESRIESVGSLEFKVQAADE
jgi:2-keto-4-pentenoate hydratase/2-oxohepta-3-ene-1,7-dioic acid hydratase in catechol pathway